MNCLDILRTNVISNFIFSVLQNITFKEYFFFQIILYVLCMYILFGENLVGFLPQKLTKWDRLKFRQTRVILDFPSDFVNLWSICCIFNHKISFCQLVIWKYKPAATNYGPLKIARLMMELLHHLCYLTWLFDLFSI